VINAQTRALAHRSTPDVGRAGGNLYDKYGAPGPIGGRLVKRFLTDVVDLARMTPATHIHEVGCGEGGISTHLAHAGYEVGGSDVSPGAVRQAQARALRSGLEPKRFFVRSISDLGSDADDAELMICCEVLEHLDRPDVALDRLTQLPAKWLILSVPREPLWRLLNLARGAYVRHLGNTPGHCQHWSRSSILRTLGAAGLSTIAVRSPVPWTVVLCQRS
jgi:2-polyprenyl-3-methyl-5-hydroxy-6-metoxy-1,4-benzoquinol methylase